MSKRNRNTQASEVTTLVPNSEGQLVEVAEVVEEIDETLDGESAKVPTEEKKSRKRGLNEEDPFLKQVIATVKTENPKRKSSKSFQRYALYEPGMTVLQFIKAGGTRGDINWDVAHGHITLAPSTAMIRQNLEERSSAE